MGGKSPTKGQKTCDHAPIARRQERSSHRGVCGGGIVAVCGEPQGPFWDFGLAVWPNGRRKKPETQPLSPRASASAARRKLLSPSFLSFWPCYQRPGILQLYPCRCDKLCKDPSRDRKFAFARLTH